MCLSVFSFYKDTTVTGFGATLIQVDFISISLTNYICKSTKTLFPYKITFWGSEQPWILGGALQPTTGHRPSDEIEENYRHSYQDSRMILWAHKVVHWYCDSGSNLQNFSWLFILNSMGRTSVSCSGPSASWSSQISGHHCQLRAQCIFTLALPPVHVSVPFPVFKDVCLDLNLCLLSFFFFTFYLILLCIWVHQDISLLHHLDEFPLQLFYACWVSQIKSASVTL